MTINTNSNTALSDAAVRAAQAELDAATARLAEAQERADFENSFETVGTLFTVVSRVPDFAGPFVSYSEEFKLVDVFATKEAADRYLAGATKPVGEELMIEERALRA